MTHVNDEFYDAREERDADLKEYAITCREVVLSTYYVEAASEEEAVIALEQHGTYLYSEESYDVLDSEVIEVQVA